MKVGGEGAQAGFVQLCWVVPHLERAVAEWVAATGAGPFFLFENVHFEDGRYRGIPADIAPHRAAIGYLGDQQIELVEPLGESPGIWRELYGPGQGGFHHGALWVEDYAATLTVWRQSGFEVAFEGRMLGAPTCYLDALATLGFFVEVISANPATAAVFSTMRAAARNWDGTAPLRRLGEAPQH